MFSVVLPALCSGFLKVYEWSSAAFAICPLPARRRQHAAVNGNAVDKPDESRRGEPPPAPHFVKSHSTKKPPRSRWLRRACSECQPFDLTAEDLEELLLARQEFRATLPIVVRLLHQGVTAQDIRHLYRVRQEVNQELSHRGISVKAIHRYTATFASAEPDFAELASEIVAIVEAVQADCHWVRTPNEAVAWVCRVAGDFRLADSRACLDWIRSSRKRRRRSYRYARGFHKEAGVA
jgi:hypothetical protein